MLQSLILIINLINNNIIQSICYLANHSKRDYFMVTILAEKQAKNVVLMAKTVNPLAKKKWMSSFPNTKKKGFGMPMRIGQS